MKSVVISVLTLLPWMPVPGLAKPAIDWLSIHWPPSRIADGVDKGQGHLDQMQQLLMAELVQYRHQVHYSNFARVEQTLAAPTAQTCMFALIYNETRGKTMFFSIPAVTSVNVMLHMRADHPLARQWRSGTGVALSEVTLDPTMNGLVERNRGYPAEVKKYLDIAGRNLTGQSLQSVNPVDLLTASRFDYLIEFPDRVRYFQSISLQKSQLVDIPIRGLDPLIYSYVACQNSAEGKLRIRDINQALQKLRGNKAYLDAMMRWLSPHRQQQVQKILPQFADDVNSPSL
ncbi:hypothetical protein EOE67_05105 [Rheinheimera riviphila]|uniref:TIGR02285 family protein n=1 Tax=Rheinheimera riviphila TaxID=1834037 RepID=A0A437R138_9GAMM|nr:hypothetical protein [Rheinheimera riviphila]RVU40431.1 hypothetical protein EOE67_05105 [Rheinheimera riviphila]